MNKINEEFNYYIEVRYLDPQQIEVIFPKVILDEVIAPRKIIFKIYDGILESDMGTGPVKHEVQDEDTAKMYVREALKLCAADYGLGKEHIVIKENDQFIEFNPVKI